MIINLATRARSHKCNRTEIHYLHRVDVKMKAVSSYKLASLYNIHLRIEQNRTRRVESAASWHCIETCTACACNWCHSGLVVMCVDRHIVGMLPDGSN